MPKFAFYCLLALLFAVSRGEQQPETKYDIKYDNIDIDELLKSDRLLTNYINCLMEEGSCTEDGKELKETLPDAIETDCSKCSEKQKIGSEKVMHYM
jgi:Insect pheromone-binding family, A10/OS-D